MDLEEHKQLRERLDSWFGSLRIDPDLASSLIVDLADFLEAAESLRSTVDRATSAENDDVNFNSVVDIDVLIQGELQWHLRSLRKLWPRVVARLEEPS